jgi:hypothetical protein
MVARILALEREHVTVLYVRLIIGIALVLLAALGPGVGLRRVTNPKVGASPGGQAGVSGVGHGASGVGHPDQRRAAVLILRILAALLGLWLLIFSSVQLLHGHGHGRLSSPATLILY